MILIQWAFIHWGSKCSIKLTQVWRSIKTFWSRSVTIAPQRRWQKHPRSTQLAWLTKYRKRPWAPHLTLLGRKSQRFVIWTSSILWLRNLTIQTLLSLRITLQPCLLIRSKKALISTILANFRLRCERGPMQEKILDRVNFSWLKY